MWSEENTKMKIYLCLYIVIGFVTAFAVWMGDKQWYYPVHSNYTYHLTCGDKTHASCQAACKQLGIDVHFTNFESGLQRFRLINSIGVWTMNSSANSNQGCSFSLDNDTLVSANCSYHLRCLCRRRMDNDVQRPNTTVDEPGKGCQKRNVSNHNRVFSNTSEYIATEKTSYKNCANMCNKHGAQLAKLNTSVLRQVRKMKGWLLKEGETNASTCNFAYKGYMFRHSKCSRLLPCLCHLNTTSENQTSRESNVTVPTTNSQTGPLWISINDRQFLINSVNLSYLRAVEYCKELEAAIVSFTNPVQYILLPRSTQLNGLRGFYWVGDGIKQENGKCLVLNSTGTTSLFSAHCKSEFYSICSRVANVSNILNHPAFVQLIQNMTVNHRKTASIERTLNCAQDNRTSAKAVGALIGTGVLTVVGGLLVLNDIQICYHKFFRRT